MAVKGRHDGAKAKFSATQGGPAPSPLLGRHSPWLRLPVAPESHEARGEPRKRRSPCAIIRRAPRWLFLQQGGSNRNFRRN